MIEQYYDHVQPPLLADEFELPKVVSGKTFSQWLTGLIGFNYLGRSVTLL
jgi:hypothetical protein